MLDMFMVELNMTKKILKGKKKLLKNLNLKKKPL